MTADDGVGTRARLAARADAVVAKLERRREQLEASRRVGVVIAMVRRFDEIDGSDLGGRITFYLVVGLIPLLIIIFAWATSFQPTASFANLLSRTYRLDSATRALVDDTFSTSDAVRIAASVVGIGSFLFVGNSLAGTLRRTFCAAWGLPFRKGVVATTRGMLWFSMLIGTQILSEAVWDVSGADRRGSAWRVAVVITFAVVGFVFWWVTPHLLLAADLGWRPLIPTALAGVIVGSLLRALAQVILPNWMYYYGVAFGGFGVVVGLTFWFWMVAYGWVVIAVFGAVYWQRLVGTDRVLAVEASAEAAAAAEAGGAAAPAPDATAASTPELSPTGSGTVRATRVAVVGPGTSPVAVEQAAHDDAMRIPLAQKLYAIVGLAERGAPVWLVLLAGWCWFIPDRIRERFAQNGTGRVRNGPGR